MTGRAPLPNGPFLVVGLAQAGQAVSLALRRRSEHVIGVDSARARDRAVLEEAGVIVLEQTEGVEYLSQVRTLVKSPGVWFSAPVIRAAQARGVPVFDELEIGWRMVDRPLIAITGTNGKTTTTNMIAHILQRSEREAVITGNSGDAVSAVDIGLPGETTLVCEVSSFQLEGCAEFAPDVAVLTNLTPDHLDRHGSMQEYREVKLRLFAQQDDQSLAVVPSDLDTALPGRATVITFGEEGDLDTAGDEIRWRGQPLLSLDELSLPFEHNRLNAMAAAAATLAWGVEPSAVRRALADFKGLPHRLEEVGKAHGVRLINDSKATNVEATLAALRAMEHGVHLILGGVDKRQSFERLLGPVANRCRAVYLVGEAASRLTEAFATSEVPVYRCGDLENAFSAALAAAAPGELVLLSPACASFDQFQNYRARGDLFRQLAQAAQEGGSGSAPGG